MSRNVVFVGDVHGNVRQLYDSVAVVQSTLPQSVEAVLQVGDFQTLRNAADLRTFPAPQRYKTLGDFHSFYEAGNVPTPTYFIGGNHEADNWLSETPDGGELINNLHYLGRSGVQEIAGMRVGWVSGNYSPTAQESPHEPKYHHFTPADVQRVQRAGGPLDVLLFHDWPSIRRLTSNIVPGTVSNTETLAHVQRRNFGSAPLFNLVAALQPKYVFTGHMHIPLEFTLQFGEAETRFVSLGKVGHRRSLALFDAEQLTIDGFYDSQGDLFSIVEDAERTMLENAFTAVEQENFRTALVAFEHIRSGTFSHEAQTFAAYGLGTTYLQQEQQHGSVSPTLIDSAIRHLETALAGMEFADAYLSLGDALVLKRTFDGSTTVVERAVASYQRAVELNPQYGEQVCATIIRLQLP